MQPFFSGNVLLWAINFAFWYSLFLWHSVTWCPVFAGNSRRSFWVSLIISSKWPFSAEDVCRMQIYIFCRFIFSFVHQVYPSFLFLISGWNCRPGKMPNSPTKKWNRWKAIKECQINMHTNYSHFCVYHVKQLEYYCSFPCTCLWLMGIYIQNLLLQLDFTEDSYFPFQISLSREGNWWQWISMVNIRERFLGSCPSFAVAQISESYLEFGQSTSKLLPT